LLMAWNLLSSRLEIRSHFYISSLLSSWQLIGPRFYYPSYKKHF
jgi:hypothetical protein